MPEPRGTMPALFVSHGSPMTALDEGGYSRALRGFASSIPLPRAIVIVSAHWEAPDPVRVTATPQPNLIYDFGGFPRELYELTYPCPGSPEVAADVVAALGEAGIGASLERERGLDHGVWVPLRLAFPEARVPVVEVSLPPRGGADRLFRIGKAIAPMRRERILVVGSGGIVHNLYRARLDREDAPVDPWAREFDAWVRDAVGRLDLEALARYSELAPGAAEAVPTREHFEPVLVVAGAALPGDRVEDVYEGFRYANLSMRSFAIRGAE